MVGSALVTGIELAAKRRSAAAFNVVHGPEVAGKHPVAKFRTVVGAMEAEDVRELHHHRALLRRLIAYYPSSSALTVRCVETAGVGGDKYTQSLREEHGQRHAGGSRMKLRGALRSTKAWSRLPPASAPPSFPLPAAAQARRWVACRAAKTL